MAQIEGIVGLSAVASAALETIEAGRAAIAGRVVHIEGFSTWAGDELIVVDEAGAQHGWVLGDIGARRVREAAAPMFGVAGLATVAVDVHGADVAAAGLSCGGRAELLLQPVTGIPGELWSRLAERAPVALLTRVDGAAAGPAAAVVAPDGTTWGAVAGGPSGVDAAVAEAVGLLANGHSATRRVEDEAGTILVEAWIPDPRLVVVGTGDLIGAIAAQAGLLGWETKAVEDRPGDGDNWPSYDQAVSWAGASGAVIVLSHDPHVDVPALGAAIDRGLPYIGAMGSRRTQSRRMERLVKLGRTEAELERIHRPIGLDLGGRSAPEVALAICAEILAVHCGRDARPLRDSDGPINDRPTR